MLVYKNGKLIGNLSTKEAAEAELAEEDFRKRVDEQKAKLRAAKWWHKFIPKITISIGKW